MEYGYAWLALGLLLGAIEMTVGTYYLLALAGGALCTGLVALVLPMNWMVQCAVFALASMIAVFLLLRWRDGQSDEGKPADDVSRLHGQRVEVIQRVAPDGRVRYKGVTWQAHADQVIESGEWARIQSVQGSTLYITKEEV
jgi:membrane protein implicated in regulation of membrane protease activity